MNALFAIVFVTLSKHVICGENYGGHKKYADGVFLKGAQFGLGLSVEKTVPGKLDDYGVDDLLITKRGEDDYGSFGYSDDQKFLDYRKIPLYQDYGKQNDQYIRLGDYENLGAFSGGYGRILPREDVSSYDKVVPRADLSSYGKFLARDDISSYGKTLPREDISSYGKSLPRDDISSYGKILSRDDISSYGRTLPRDDISSYGKSLQRDDISSYGKILTRDDVASYGKSLPREDVSNYGKSLGRDHIVNYGSGKTLPREEIVSYGITNAKSVPLSADYAPNKEYYNDEEQEYRSLIARLANGRNGRQRSAYSQGRGNSRALDSSLLYADSQGYGSGHYYDGAGARPARGYLGDKENPIVLASASPKGSSGAHAYGGQFEAAGNDYGQHRY